jgi:Protein of unknown function (DUF1064)
MINSFFKKTKFNNVRQTFNGYSYDSKLEARVAADLELRVKAKDIISYERQFKIDLRINDKHLANYFCDFRLLLPDGTYELLEVKSPATVTPVYKLKVKILEAAWLPEHPDHVYNVVYG